MMKIDVSQIKQELGSHTTFKFVTTAEELDLFDEKSCWTSKPITIEGEVVNNGQSLVVRGAIKANSSHECNRCLEPFVSDMDIPFLENYYSPDFVGSEDEDLVTYDGNEIEITDLIRESMVLAEPLKPLCSETCQGLCPKCGTNLNLQTCSCEKGSVDPRLAVLQQLLENKAKEV